MKILNALKRAVSPNIFLLLSLTFIIVIGLSGLIEKEHVGAWQLVSLCFVLATLFLTLPKDHGKVFTRIGFQISFSGILIIIANGFFEGGIQQLALGQDIYGNPMKFAGWALSIAALAFLSWSMAEIFVESFMRILKTDK